MPHPGFEPERDRVSISFEPAFKLSALLLTSSDIIECTGVGIQEWVQKPERTFPSRKELVVDQRDDGGENRARAAGAVDRLNKTVGNDFKVNPNGSDVWNPASRAVELARLCVTESIEEALDRGSLVIRDAKKVGESAR